MGYEVTDICEAKYGRSVKLLNSH